MVSAQASAHLVDRELVSAARDGDVEAFGVLFARHHGPLVRYLTYHTRDRELAADLAQEAFLDAFRRLERLAGEVSFAAWLYRIALNHARMAARRQRLRQFVSLDWLAEPVAALVPTMRREGEDARCHDRDQLQRTFDGLSPPLRDALLLHSLEGFTAPEVARILGIKLSAAERRLSRAKIEFRRQWDALNAED